MIRGSATGRDLVSLEREWSCTALLFYELNLCRNFAISPKPAGFHERSFGRRRSGAKSRALCDLSHGKKAGSIMSVLAAHPLLRRAHRASHKIVRAFFHLYAPSNLARSRDGGSILPRACPVRSSSRERRQSADVSCLTMRLAAHDRNCWSLMSSPGRRTDQREMIGRSLPGAGGGILVVLATGPEPAPAISCGHWGRAGGGAFSLSATPPRAR